LNGFIKKAKYLDKKFFVTKKGLEIGSKKEKALKIYGLPDKTSKKNGYEKLEWHFVGQEMYLDDGKKDKKGRPHAEGVWGYEVEMFFKTNKLEAMIICNDPP